MSVCAFGELFVVITKFFKTLLKFVCIQQLIIIQQKLLLFLLINTIPSRVKNIFRHR